MMWFNCAGSVQVSGSDMVWERDWLLVDLAADLYFGGCSVLCFPGGSDV